MKNFIILILSVFIISACKKDKEIALQSGLDGNWKFDSTGFSWMTNAGHNYWQINANKVQELHEIFPIELNGKIQIVPFQTGIITLNPDTSFSNPVTKVKHSGKNIRIDFYNEESRFTGFTKGVYELSKDSLLIHTSCCYKTFRYSRVKILP
jgi:hypothetical protein